MKFGKTEKEDTEWKKYRICKRMIDLYFWMKKNI